MRKIFTSIATAVMATALITAGAAPAATSKSRLKAQKLPAPTEQTALPKLVKENHKVRGVKQSSFASISGSRLRYTPGKMLRPAAAAAAGTTMNGCVLFSSAGDTNGMYEFSPTGAMELLCDAYDMNATYGGVELDGVYFSSYLYDLFGLIQVPYSYAWNTEDWSMIYEFIGNGFEMFALGMDHNSNGTIYGCFYNEAGSGYEWGTLTIGDTEPSRETIAPMEDPYFFVGFDANDQCWALDATMALGKVDVATGAFTKVSDTGLDHYYISGGAIDKKQNVLYYSVNTDTEEAMYAIDLATYEVSKMYDMTCEVNGCYIPAPAAEDNAPGYPSNFNVAFEAGSLGGTVSFKAPNSLFDGTPATGALNFTVLCNDEVILEGATEYGATYSKYITVDEPGMYTFRMYCTNAAGNGPKSDKVTLWVGNDQPLAPQQVTASYDDEAQVMTISWDPVEASVHDGYIVPADVRYYVYRFANGDADGVVANGTPETTVSQALATPANLTNYYYAVIAEFGGLRSAQGMSNSVVLGTIVPPYNESFDDPSSVDNFTVLDNNGDGRSFQWYDGRVRVQYNSTMNMDDYLVTAAVELEAGKAYEISVAAWSYSLSFGSETFELLMGTAPTVEALTFEVIPETALEHTTPVVYSGVVNPAVSGKYYFAVHGISAPDVYYLEIDDFAISAPFSAGAPAACSDAKFTPDASGAPKATVSFKTPTQTVAGEALTSLAKVEVSRNGELIKTFNSPAVGAELSFADEAPAAGEYTYSFVAYNAEGSGKTLNVTQWMGANYGAVPTDVVMTANETPGEVTVTWTPVAEDINGNPLDIANIEYVIIDKDGSTVLAQVPAAQSTFTYQATDGSVQQFVWVFFMPVTARGTNSSNYTASNMVPVGPAYEMPYQESFAGGSLNSIWGVTFVPGESEDNLSTSWVIAEGCSAPECTPYDGDGGMMAWRADGDGMNSFLFSGKIKVVDNEAVAFSFYYFGDPGVYDYTVQPVVIIGNEIYEAGEEFSPGDAAAAEWTQCIRSLADYVGEEVQVGFFAFCNEYTSLLCIDNIEVRAFADYDLAVKSVNAPSKLAVNEDNLVSVTVANYGTKAAGAFSVALYHNGEELESVELDGLAAGSTDNVAFTVVPDLFWGKSAELQAKVVFDADEVLENNESKVLNVPVAQSTLPAPEALTGEVEGSDVTLTWTAPDLSSYSSAIVDSAEDYEAFEVDNAGAWTFVDLDKSDTYGFNGITFDNQGYVGSFIVFDQTINASLDGMAHTGDKVFACFAATSGHNDDWMISPELGGFAQTVTFWARAWMEDYGLEEYEFLYSTTGKETSDFIVLGENHSVGADWTEYSYDLPEGTKYFAIRCVSNDRFIFLVDDISFALTKAELTLVGYDIYRDGDLLTTVDANVTTYTDANVEEGAHTYYVTAVYAEGESALSPAFNTEITGLETVKAAAKVYTEGRAIVVAGAADLRVAIYAADGKMVYSTAKAADITRVPVQQGVYVVDLNGKVAKVSVR